MGSRARGDYSVEAVTFFGRWQVASFPTLEQAERRVQELEEEMERQPRGYVQYVVRRPSEGRRGR
jgi:hypothetical protein